MSTYHWRCDCGAYGHSNIYAANVVVMKQHRDRGHTVTSWLRGFKENAVTFEDTDE